MGSQQYQRSKGAVSSSSKPGTGGGHHDDQLSQLPCHMQGSLLETNLIFASVVSLKTTPLMKARLEHVLHQTLLQLTMHEAASNTLTSRWLVNVTSETCGMFRGLQTKGGGVLSWVFVGVLVSGTTRHLHDSGHKSVPRLSAMPMVGKKLCDPETA